MTAPRATPPPDGFDTYDRARAAEPLRAWFADGAPPAAEPLPGLAAALAAGASAAPVELDSDELEYLDDLFGDRSPFVVPGRTPGAPSRPQLRSRLIDRGILCADPPRRGAFDATLAPEHLAGIGVAFLAPRATFAWIIRAGAQATETMQLVRAGAWGVVLELIGDDRWRLTPLPERDAVARFIDWLPRLEQSTAGTAFEVAAADLERFDDLWIAGRGDEARRELPALANYRTDPVEAPSSLVLLRDRCCAQPDRFPQSASIDYRITPHETWVIDERQEVLVRLERVDRAGLDALLDTWVRGPGPVATAQAAAQKKAAARAAAEKVADAEAAAAEAAAARTARRRILRALRLAWKTFIFVIWVLRVPTDRYGWGSPWERPREPTPATPTPTPPPPVRGLTQPAD